MRAVTAFAYLRISKEIEGSTALDRQRHDIEAHLARRDVTDIVWFEDAGRSAWSRRTRRPAWEEMMARAVAEKPALVAVWRIDRFARSMRDFIGAAEALDDAGVGLVVTQQDFDTSTPIGKMVLRILASFAEFESDMISARLLSVEEHRERLGVPHRGRRHFGWTHEGQLHPIEAPVLLDVVERVLTTTDSSYDIARQLHACGVVTTSGVPMAAASLWRILRSPRLVGHARRKDGVLRDKDGLPMEVWEPLVDDWTWRRLQRALDARSVGAPNFAGHRGVSTGRRPLLAGVARCAHCGSAMRVTGGKLPIYQCSGHANQRSCPGGGASILTEYLEGRVLDELRFHLAGRQHVEPAADDDRARVAKATLQAVDGRREILSRLFFVDGFIDEEEFRRRRLELDREAADAEAVLDELAVVAEPVLLDEVLDRWDDLDLSEQRAVVLGFVERVTVVKRDRGRYGTDPERVKVSFR
jgi:DNA invertase Pin-like site-specific DNA recombinase